MDSGDLTPGPALIHATYVVASPLPPREVAEFIAMEGSVGVPSYAGPHRAHVVSLEPCDVPGGLAPVPARRRFHLCPTGRKRTAADGPAKEA